MRLRSKFLTRNPRAIADRPRPTAGIHCAASLRVKTQILDPDGSIVKDNPWRKNLIVDQGLDGVFVINTGVWANQTLYCHIGTGTDPFFRDSGTTTVAVASGVATANASFFEAADVGRLLKLDSGEEGYITGFTSATEVAVSMADAAASEATVWYVDRTGLTTETKRTLTLRTTGGDNGTTYQTVPARSFVFKRSHLFTAEAGPVTYTEVGWGPVNTGAIFSGLVLSGGGDSLTAGQQYLVISELTMTPSPTTAVAAPDVATGGWNSEGDINIETIGSQVTNGIQAFSSVSSTGTVFGTNPAAPLEPSWTQNPALRGYLSDFTLQTPSATTQVTGGGAVNANSVTPQAYVPGNFFRDVVATWNTSTANGDWRGVGIQVGSDRGLSVRFDVNQTKDNQHTVTATFRISVGRTLVN